MTTAEMKLKSIIGIATMNDEKSIQDVLNLLDTLNKEVPENNSFMKHAMSIMQERSTVLQRLADYDSFGK